MRKKIVCIVIVVLLLLAGTAGVCYATMNPYRGTVKGNVVTKDISELLTREQAKEDLEFAMDKLRTRHPAWLEEDARRREETERQFQQELQELDKKEKITVLEVWQAASRILNKLQDGHTITYMNMEQPRYINDFTQLQNGYELVSVNGIPIEELYKQFCSIFSYEREQYARCVFYDSVIVSEMYLNWCDVDTKTGATFTFKTEEGEKEYTYSFVPIEKVKRNNAGENEDTRWVSYEIDKKNAIGIFTLRSCMNNDEYKNTVKNFFEEAEAENIQHIIIDLRENGGGMSSVLNEFLTYVNVDGYYEWASEIRFGNILYHDKREYRRNRKKTPLFDGDIYVLTDLHSYSSAMDFAMVIGDNGIGVIVGEASGNMPDAYGDCLQFALPNSRLNMSVSFKRWHRVDESKEGQPLEPDYPCNSREAMDKAYELITGSHQDDK